MRIVPCICLIGTLGASGAVPAAAQNPADDSTPPFLQIIREEVKPGKGPAHLSTETSWAAAFAKHKMTFGWLGTTAITGPSEAWFFTGVSSWDELEKNMKAEEANEALRAEVEKIQAQDGEALTRASSILARFRPTLSYQPKVNVAQMRYVRVQLVRIKPGHDREFVDSWEEAVRSHEKAKMDEHWAYYQVVSGMPAGTYMYLQAFKSLGEIDKLTPMHVSDAYRTAVGDGGRSRGLEATRAAVEFSTDLVFAFNPKMSYVPKHWVDADPTYWAPQPAAPKKPAEKK